MRKVSIIIPHYKTWRWTAICINAFKKYGTLIDSEIIVCNNSPGHPSIKCLTDTELGNGVKIVDGRKDFHSHGMGYDIAFSHADGDWIFTSETDSFPIRHGWFEPYIIASVDHDLIGPMVPQSSGSYIHPAGAIVSRKVLDKAKEWRDAHKDWVFVPGAAVTLGVASWPYHVVMRDSSVPPDNEQMRKDVELWRDCGSWQEMRSFDHDSLQSYTTRTGITNFDPVPGVPKYIKIGYEAGQWLSYFAKSGGFRVMEAPCNIEWMPGLHGKQAAQSTVFDCFRHVWCGTVSNLPNDISASVRVFKLQQQENEFAKLEASVRRKILELEATWDKTATQ